MYLVVVIFSWELAVPVHCIRLYNKILRMPSVINFLSSYILSQHLKWEITVKIHCGVGVLQVQPRGWFITTVVAWCEWWWGRGSVSTLWVCNGVWDAANPTAAAPPEGYWVTWQCTGVWHCGCVHLCCLLLDWHWHHSCWDTGGAGWGHLGSSGVI